MTNEEELMNPDEVVPKIKEGLNEIYIRWVKENEQIIKKWNKRNNRWNEINEYLEELLKQWVKIREMLLTQK